MRVVISAPRKTGGAQLRCLLSMAYDLKAPPVSAPASSDAGEIASWFAGLPAESVSTCDLPFATLANVATSSNVHLIGVIRHPFDLFVSNYDVAQQWAARGHEDHEGHHAWSALSGEDLGSETTLAYAATGFASDVGALREWADSSNAIRYEDLIEDPAAVLASLCFVLGPLTGEQIAHAAELCPAENVVASRPGRGRRMPSLPPGAWRERLPSTLVMTLRERYSEDVKALGYDVP